MVLATNVAETSLTVPRIRYVVDTGDARVKRYSYRNKVEMLRVEPISQAAAQQRAGRCGRVADGICIRLYSEEEFAKRPAFTDPELLRSSLASVILRAKSLGLGEVEAFPFVDPPSPRAIADGYDLLAELGAVDEEKELTAVGQELARLPLDPRVGAHAGRGARRGLPRAGAHHRRRAVGAGSARAAAGARRGGRRAPRALRRRAIGLPLASSSCGSCRTSTGCGACAARTSSPIPRMREWRDVHEQLKQALEWARSPRSGRRRPRATARSIARCSPACSATSACATKEGAYTGARGIKFWVHPGLVDQEAGQVDRRRRAGRDHAPLRAHRRGHRAALAGGDRRASPQAQPRRSALGEGPGAGGGARARHALRPAGLRQPARAVRRRYDPDLARDVFIRAALVEGDFDTRAPFFAHNRRLLADIERLEHKSRRPDILVDDELIHAFYDERIPKEINSSKAFELWRAPGRGTPSRACCYLAREDLMRHEAAGITTDNFPPSLAARPQPLRARVPLRARLGARRRDHDRAARAAQPGAGGAHRMAGARPAEGEGARRSPSRCRSACATSSARSTTSPPRFVAAVPPSDVPLDRGPAPLRARASFNLEVPLDAFRPDSAPPHLHMNFRVLDEHGRQLDMGRRPARS